MSIRQPARASGSRAQRMRTGGERECCVRDRCVYRVAMSDLGRYILCCLDYVVAMSSWDVCVRMHSFVSLKYIDFEGLQYWRYNMKYCRNIMLMNDYK